MNLCCYYLTIFMAHGKWRPCMLLSSEYTLCSSLNIKEHLPQNMCNIWSLSEYRTDKWLRVWIPLLSHIVLCLNAFAKLQNLRGASCQPVLMGNCPICLYVLLALSVHWMFLLSVRSKWCARHEILWPWNRCLLRRKMTQNICR